MSGLDMLVACAYLGFVVFGIVYVAEGKTALGVLLLVLTASGVPAYIAWRRAGYPR